MATLVPTSLVLAELPLIIDSRSWLDYANDWLADHGGLLYPVVGLLLVGIVVGALMAFAQGEDETFEKTTARKQRIVDMLHLRLGGVLVSEVAAALQIDGVRAQQLLDELVTEGVLNADGLKPPRYSLRAKANPAPGSSN